MCLLLLEIYISCQIFVILLEFGVVGLLLIYLLCTTLRNSCKLPHFVNHACIWSGGACIDTFRSHESTLSFSKVPWLGN